MDRTTIFYSSIGLYLLILAIAFGINVQTSKNKTVLQRVEEVSKYLSVFFLYIAFPIGMFIMFVKFPQQMQLELRKILEFAHESLKMAMTENAELTDDMKNQLDMFTNFFTNMNKTFSGVTESALGTSVNPLVDKVTGNAGGILKSLI